MPAETGEATRRDALRVGPNFAPSTSTNGCRADHGEFQNFTNMAQSANTLNTTANANNEVVNPQSTTNVTPKGGKTSATPKAESADSTPKGGKGKAQEPSTQRVENRGMWNIVFDNIATLLAMAVNGEAVTPDNVEGFAFGKKVKCDKQGNVLEVAAKRSLASKDQPNIRGYLYSLLAAFGSKKGIKHSKGTALENLDLEEVAKSVALGLWPKFDWDKNVGKAEPKQAKSLIAAVIAKL